MSYPIQAQVSADGVRWMLKRNCSLSPSQLASMFLALGTLSFVVAGFWAFVGAWYVLVFASIEIAALGLAFFMYARHAADYESVEVKGDTVSIECASGVDTERLQGRRGSFQLAFTKRRKALVEVQAAGQRLSLGRFVPEGQREAFAQALAKSLRAPLYRSTLSSRVGSTKE